MGRATGGRRRGEEAGVLGLGEVGAARSGGVLRGDGGGGARAEGGGGGDRAAEEGLKVGEELRLVHAEVVIEEEEELALHEVDFGRGEKSRVASPVLVLGGRVWRRERSVSARSLEGRRLKEGSPFKYLAATMRVARKTRWRVQCMPLATLGRRSLRRSR